MSDSQHYVPLMLLNCEITIIQPFLIENYLFSIAIELNNFNLGKGWDRLDYQFVKGVQGTGYRIQGYRVQGTGYMPFFKSKVTVNTTIFPTIREKKSKILLLKRKVKLLLTLPGPVEVFLHNKIVSCDLVSLQCPAFQDILVIWKV